MLDLLKKLFSPAPSVDYKSLKKQGAVILDVRSSGEFKSGHIRGAINIPVNDISHQLNKLKKDKAVICYCASGMRSATATRQLKKSGYEAYNAGSMGSLEYKL